MEHQTSVESFSKAFTLYFCDLEMGKIPFFVPSMLCITMGKRFSFSFNDPTIIEWSECCCCCFFFVLFFFFFVFNQVESSVDFFQYFSFLLKEGTFNGIHFNFYTMKLWKKQLIAQRCVFYLIIIFLVYLY